MTEIVVLYDNRAMSDLRPGFGFSTFIRTEGAIVMLDTGADKMVLEHNAERLGVSLESVSALVLSHDHCDHMGAMRSVFHPGLHFYVPQAVAKRFARIRRSGIDLHMVKGPVDIVPGVRSIGQMGRKIPEQALLLDGADGPVLITGCAHMGIAKLVKRATDLAGVPMALVLGGFHLFREKKEAIDCVIADLLELSIGRIGPCHCTGGAAIATIREVFGDDYIEMGVGTRIEI